MIEWTTGNDLLPIYHVDGELNSADFLTKKHELSINDLSTDRIPMDETGDYGYAPVSLPIVDNP